MFEHFSQTGSFLGKGTRIEIKRRYWDLIVWLLWAIVLCWPVVYYSGKIFLSGSLYVQLSAVAVVVIGRHLHFISCTDVVHAKFL